MSKDASQAAFEPSQSSKHMKRIEAYIRVNKLDEVKHSLEEAGIFGLSCEQVRGYGRQMGRTDKYRGSTYAVNLLPKMKLEVIVKDEDLETAVEAISTAAQTGEIGDGKIFVSEVLEAIRVRTGERGDAALS
jgi:nitrogen regulatory protein P-II 1